MPELPEVETVRRILEKNLIGKKISYVKVFYDKILENVDKNTFCNKLIGETFRKMERVGKYLIFILDTMSLVVHLRMEGKFFFKKQGDFLSFHEHVEIGFDSKDVLRYHDTRKFGKFVLLNTTKIDEIILYPALSKLGPDANKAPDAELIYSKIKKYSGCLKTALLDQTIMAGIGNIYADEICFITKFHPETKCNTLTIDDVRHIIDASHQVLDLAIEQGGTTIRSYTSSLGVTGRFQQLLLVHSREGKECPTCKTIIKKIRVAGRGTYFCPKCQKLKDKINIIGITGVIASGKTVLTDYLTCLGYKVIDADVINREILNPGHAYYLELYASINEKFPNAILDGQISKKKLREIIFNREDLRIELQNIIYPIIKKIIINEIKCEKFDIIIKNKPQVMFLSAPLLIESGFDAFCDELVIIDVNRQIQLKRIIERDNVSYDDALVAAKIRLSIDQLIRKAKMHHFSPYVIENNQEQQNLYNQFNKVLEKIMED